MRRPAKAAGPAITLSKIRDKGEISLGYGDAAWSLVTAWQKKGWVRLRWTDNGVCWIGVTEAGTSAISSGDVV